MVVKAGQMAADEYFMFSAYAGLFANLTFGAMPSLVEACKPVSITDNRGLMPAVIMGLIGSTNRTRR